LLREDIIRYENMTLFIHSGFEIFVIKKKGNARKDIRDFLRMTLFIHSGLEIIWVTF